jgi:hypothetical protein
MKAILSKARVHQEVPVKNPVLAAVLNFFFFGGGTLYVGRRMGVGLLATIGGTMAQISEIAVSPAGSNAIPSVWPFLLGGLVVLKLGLVLDAWNEAKAVNAELGARAAA